MNTYPFGVNTSVRQVSSWLVVWGLWLSLGCIPAAQADEVAPLSLPEESGFMESDWSPPGILSADPEAREEAEEAVQQDDLDSALLEGDGSAAADFSASSAP